MTRNAQRHLLATLTACAAIGLLSAVVAANGFRDFGSALWLFDAATIAALAYTLVILIARAKSFQDEVWRRAATFGAITGAVFALLAFVRLAALNASGIGVSIVLSGALGAALGLALIEGLRWVRGTSPSARETA